MYLRDTASNALGYKFCSYGNRRWARLSAVSEGFISIECCRMVAPPSNSAVT